MSLDQSPRGLHHPTRAPPLAELRRLVRGERLDGDARRRITHHVQVERARSRPHDVVRVVGQQAISGQRHGARSGQRRVEDVRGGVNVGQRQVGVAPVAGPPISSSIMHW